MLVRILFSGIDALSVGQQVIGIVDAVDRLILALVEVSPSVFIGLLMQLGPRDARVQWDPFA
jgi:hypothetical protein